MKRYIPAVLAATLIAGLTACGGGAQQASSTGAASATATPSRTAQAVPDVAGKTFSDAQTALSDKGFVVSIVGKDGVAWPGGVDDTVKAVSTVPAAGTVTDARDIAVKVNFTQKEYLAAADAAGKVAADAAKTAADAAKLAARYQFACGPQYSTTEQDTYKSLKEVWASPHYAGSDTCSVTYDGQDTYGEPPVVPSEQKIIDIVKANGGDASGTAIQTFDTVMGLCTKLEPDYADQIPSEKSWKKANAKAALALCPNAPHAGLLKDALTAVKIDDGTHTVGQDMEPGTYRTKPSAKDCYWSRTTGGGNIIANDMVGFAPAGVTVTVYPGEGFESNRCGVWTKIG